MAEDRETPGKLSGCLSAIWRTIFGIALVGGAGYFAWKLAFEAPTLRWPKPGGDRDSPAKQTAAPVKSSDHAAEVASLAQRPNVYLARRSHASGALEGVLAQHRAQRNRHRQNRRIPA